MTTLALIERQLALKNQQAKAKADADDLKAAIRSAVREALAEAGVTAAPRQEAPPSPPELPRAWRWTRPLRDYSPLPPSPPQSPPAPSPMPAPVTFPDTVIERNELGDITGMSGQYGKLTVRRNHTGVIDTVFLNGKPLTRFVRGFDNRIVKLEPLNTKE